MENSRPLVSVLIAVKDGAKTISDVLDALLVQSYSNIEIVIVNDGSTDKTGDILERYQQKDKRIKVITNKKNLGRCKSRNIGIEECKGKYIAINDADDISCPHRIETEVRYLEQNLNVYLVVSRANILDENGKRIAISWGKKYPEDISKLLLEKNVVVHSSIMFRNKKEFLYREKFPRAQDYDFYLQIISRGNRVDLLPNILVGYKSKKDIEYGEYLIDQIVFSYTMRKLAQEYIQSGKDSYDMVTKEYMYKIFPKDELDTLYFLQSYTQGEYKKARKQILGIIKKYKITPKRILYLIDSYLGGSIFTLGKGIKRYFRNIFNI